VLARFTIASLGTSSLANADALPRGHAVQGVQTRIGSGRAHLR
jgi:hypothetical protein